MNKLMNRSQRKRLHNLFQKLPWLAGWVTGAALLAQTPLVLAAGEIQVKVEFNPITITQGDSSSLTLTIRNNEPSPLNNVNLNKALPAGLAIDTSKAITQNSCNFTLANTTANLNITDGTLPAFDTGSGTPGLCILELPVIGKKAPGSSVTLQIGVGEFSAGGFSNSAAAQNTITVNQLGNLGSTMAFIPTELPAGGATKFRLTLPNSTGKVLNNATFTNGFTMPAGFTLRAGSLNNTCGGSVSITGTPPTIKLISGTIPTSGCVIEFEMDGPFTEQTFGPVSWAAGDLVTDLEVSNNAASSNTGSIVAGMKISQSFNRNNVFINEASTLTIRIRNANDTAVNNANLQSLISASNGGVLSELQLVNGTGNINSNCPTTPSATYNGTNGQLNFTNVSIPAATLGPNPAAKVAECQITIQVITDKDGIGTYTSAIAANQLATNQTAATNTSLIVTDLVGDGGNGVSFGFGFGPVGGGFASYEVAASNRGRLRITLNNVAGETLTGVGIGGTGIALETGLRIADAGVFNNTCTANDADIIAALNATSITLTSATINRRGSCSFEINVVSDQFKLGPGYAASVAAGVVTTAPVTGQAGRTYSNAAGSSGPNFLEVTDYLNIIPSMATSTVAPNADARIKLRLTNSEDQAKSQLRLRYRLPFAIALTPDFFAGPGCGIDASAFQVVEVSPGVFELQADNIQIPARGTTGPTDTGNAQDGVCDVAFDVQAPGTPGGQTVTVPPNVLQNTDGTQQNRTSRSTSFTVQPLNLNLSQSIINEEIGAGEAVDLVKGGQPAMLIITLNNPGNPVPLTNIVLNDTLEDPKGLIYPGGQPTTTCTGAGGPATATVDEATKSFRLEGADLASGQSCILRVPVTTLAVDQLQNIVPAGAAVSAEGAKTNQDDDQIQVSSNLGLVKAFSPTTIQTGETARLTLTVLNATTAGYNDVRLTDNLPEGLTLASNPNVTSTCGATSAPGDGAVIQVNNGAVNANAVCWVEADVTSLIANPGGYVNAIPVGGLKAGSFQNTEPAEATLFVNGTTIEQPNLRLVKRITELKTPVRPGYAEQTTAITSVNNFTPAAGPDADNAPGWPNPLDASGISSYIKGAFNTSQVPGGQSAFLVSGMEIEYTGYYLSNGTVSAGNTSVCDFVPANTTYVPGSLVWEKGDGTETPLSDAVGAAGGFYANGESLPGSCVGTNNNKGAVVVNLGNLPQSTGPGAPAASYGKIRFRVKVD